MTTALYVEIPSMNVTKIHGINVLHEFLDYSGITITEQLLRES